MDFWNELKINYVTLKQGKELIMKKPFKYT